MLGNNSSFRALENFVKIQNVRLVGSHIHYVHGKEKSILFLLLGK
jgi:predicted RNA binding protein YcfA (HicA-like mRNA interferase family)